MWSKVDEHRYENAATNEYVTYLPENDEHEEFWYLNQGTTDKVIRGAASPQELGVPDNVVKGIEEINPRDNDPTIGHNSNIAADRLKSFVARIERLDEERKALSEDIKDIFGEAKSAGFDVAVLRMLLRLRKMDPRDVEEREMLLDIYRRAVE